MVFTCILSRQQEWYTITQRFLQWDYPIEEPFFVITQLPQIPYIRNFSNEPTLKSKACLKCLYFTIIIFDLCRYLEYFSYLYTINQTE